MKKTIPPIQRHLQCECQIVIGPFGPHQAKIVCIKHRTFVQWVSKKNIEVLEPL